MDRLLLLSLKWSVCTYIRPDGKTVMTLSLSKNLSVHNALTTATKNPKKPLEDNITSPTLKHSNEREGVKVIHRLYFQRLLRFPKPPRAQLIIDLPILQALRTGEISTQQAEWIDVEHGDMQVLDSKKGIMFTIPLDPTFTKHFIQYGVFKGTLITGRKHTGKGLHSETIERIWGHYSIQANGFPMNPRLGRAYKACSMLYGFDPVTGEKRPKKSIVCVQHTLRHGTLQATEHYVDSRKLVDYDFFKAEFLEGMTPSFSLSSTVCSRFGACPLSAPECKCRMFQPQEMEVSKFEES